MFFPEKKLIVKRFVYVDKPNNVGGNGWKEDAQIAMEFNITQGDFDSIRINFFMMGQNVEVCSEEKIKELENKGVKRQVYNYKD